MRQSLESYQKEAPLNECPEPARIPACATLATSKVYAILHSFRCWSSVPPRSAGDAQPLANVAPLRSHGQRQKPVLWRHANPRGRGRAEKYIFIGFCTSEFDVIINSKAHAGSFKQRVEDGKNWGDSYAPTVKSQTSPKSEL